MFGRHEQMQVDIGMTVGVSPGLTAFHPGGQKVRVPTNLSDEGPQDGSSIDDRDV